MAWIGREKQLTSPGLSQNLIHGLFVLFVWGLNRHWEPGQVRAVTPGLSEHVTRDVALFYHRVPSAGLADTMVTSRLLLF